MELGNDRSADISGIVFEKRLWKTATGVNAMGIFQPSETHVRDCAVAVLKLCGGDPALCYPPTALQHTTRQSERRSFLEFLLAAPSKLRGSFSVDEFRVEMTDAVAPVSYSPSSASVTQPSFFFQGIQFVIPQVN
jgi:hypothetical protein